MQDGNHNQKFHNLSRQHSTIESTSTIKNDY